MVSVNLRPDPLARVVLSVVVPARDEAPNLVRLRDEVAATLDPHGIAWELIVVDDGSIDETPALLATLVEHDPRVRSLRFEHSRGQTAALVGGFRVARGEYIATLDADLQCPVDDLPILLGLLDHADLACGVRTGRRDPLSKKIASAFSNVVRRLVLAPGVRDLACPLRVFRRSALAEIERVTPLFDGAHRWLPALFGLAGLRIVQRPIVHQPRVAGVSKYTTRGRVRPVLHELGRVLAVAVRRPSRARTLLVVGVLGLASIPFLYGLGAWPLIEPDEARNAEVAREMLAGGHWSIPHFDGLPYLDKPILFFWMVAAAFRVFGASEAAARLPSALAGLATIALTFEIGRTLLGWRRGLLAAVVLATSPIVLAYGRLVIFDLPLTAFVTAALYCLVRARQSGDDRLWLPLAGLAMGLAILTKGPVGIAVPLLAWFAGRGALPRRQRGTFGPRLAATAAVALVVVPWLVLVARQEPDFLRYAFVDETFHRLTSAEQFHREAPVYFYAETLAWALGIWGVVLAALAPTLVRCWRRGGRDAAVTAFAVRGTLALLVFFTLSASKRPHYILPAMVPIALLVAIAIDADRARTAAVLRIAAWAVGLAGAGLLVAMLLGVRPPGGFTLLLTPRLLSAVGVCLVAWAAVTLAAGPEFRRAVACAALFTPLLGMAIIGPLAGYAEARSSRELARHAKGARVMSFETFPMSLPFYLGRPVPLVSRSAMALTSNYLLQKPSEALGSQLVLPRNLRALLAGDDPPLVVAKRSDVARLRAMSARGVEIVYADRKHALLRPLE
jgi:4-amino-4-deoxy-L-arabinose transferase-like glycosyltransferase